MMELKKRAMTTSRTMMSGVKSRAAKPTIRKKVTNEEEEKERHKGCLEKNQTPGPGALKAEQVKRGSR